MGSDNGNDFLNSDFPMYAAAGVGLFGVYRAFVSKSRGEAMQPAWMSSGTFPAAFFTGIGTMACHEMLMDMMAFPGGWTAWAPAVLTVCACSWVAYRGQRAASGGSLGVASIVPAVVIVCLAVSWLVADVVEPPKTLTKAQMKKAAKEAAKKAAKAAAVSAPVAKMLSLESGTDVVSEYMHVALAVAVLLALILGLVNGPGEWPRNLEKGAFPACFMVASGVIAWNSFLREARSFGEGSADDFVPALAAMVVACIGASAGSKMQA